MFIWKVKCSEYQGASIVVAWNLELLKKGDETDFKLSLCRQPLEDWFIIEDFSIKHFTECVQSPWYSLTKRELKKEKKSENSI